MLGRITPHTTNINARINSSSPNALAISLAQDILINAGFQMDARPLQTQEQFMSVPVLGALQVTLSPEKKDFSLIRKQTSELDLSNPSLLDPAVLATKPGLSTADQLGMPMEPANTIFEQDSPPTLNQHQQFISSNMSNRGTPDLAVIAAKFCTAQFSVSGKTNKYFHNCQEQTRVIFTGKGRNTRKSNSYRSPDTRQNKRMVMAPVPMKGGYQILPGTTKLPPAPAAPTGYRKKK